MQRKAFDRITSAGGAALVVVLVVAGALLTWGHSYVNNEVHGQLAMQQIYFPPKAVWATAKPGTEIEPIMKPYLYQYSGQELLSGPQAEAYANHFIRYHLYNMPDHGVYSKISAAALAAKPGSAQATGLKALEQVSFQGTTLRGLLLEAYGFWKIGEIMLWGAIASFIMAAILAVLVGLGFAHARSTVPEQEMFRRTAQAAVPAA